MRTTSSRLPESRLVSPAAFGGKPTVKTQHQQRGGLALCHPPQLICGRQHEYGYSSAG